MDDGWWWMDGWIDGWLDGWWMHGCMVGWMDGWIDGWLDGWMDDGCMDVWLDGWIDGWLDGWMDDGCMDAWLDGWFDGWIDGWMWFFGGRVLNRWEGKDFKHDTKKTTCSPLLSSLVFESFHFYRNIPCCPCSLYMCPSVVLQCSSSPAEVRQHLHVFPRCSCPLWGSDVPVGQRVMFHTGHFWTEEFSVTIHVPSLPCAPISGTPAPPLAKRLNFPDDIASRTFRHIAIA